MSLPRSLKPAGILETALVDTVFKHISEEILNVLKTGPSTCRWASLNYLAKEQDTLINTPLHPTIKQMRFADAPGALIPSNCPQLLELNRLLTEDLKKFQGPQTETIQAPQIETKGDQKSETKGEQKRPSNPVLPYTAPTIRDHIMVRKYKRRSAIIDRLPTSQPSLSLIPSSAPVGELPEIKTEDFVDVQFPIADAKQLGDAYSEMKTTSPLEKLFIRFTTHKKHREVADEKRLEFLNREGNEEFKLQYDRELAEEELWLKQAVTDFENSKKIKPYTGDESKLLKGNDAYLFMLDACPLGIDGEYTEGRIYVYTKVLQDKFPEQKLFPEVSSEAQVAPRRHHHHHRQLGRLNVDTSPALDAISKILNDWLKMGENFKNGEDFGSLRAADSSRELKWYFDPESFNRFGENYLRVYAQLPDYSPGELTRLRNYVEYLKKGMSNHSAAAMQKVVTAAPAKASAPAIAAAHQPLPVRTLPGMGAAPAADSAESKAGTSPAPTSGAPSVSTVGHFAAPAVPAPAKAPAKKGGMGARAAQQFVRS